MLNACRAIPTGITGALSHLCLRDDQSVTGRTPRLPDAVGRVESPTALSTSGFPSFIRNSK